jgi:hypothetical protein
VPRIMAMMKMAMKSMIDTEDIQSSAASGLDRAIIRRAR